MNDFLIKHYSLLTHSVEIMAAVVGILLYNKYKLSSAKYFIYFLIYVSICDVLGNYTSYIKNNGSLSFLEGTLFEENYWWYNLFWELFAILFFIFFYNKTLKNKQFKSILKYSGYAFFVFSVIYFTINFNDFLNTTPPLIGVLGALIIILCAIFYFIDTLLSDSLLSFYKSINFYISLTIFIWTLITAPLLFYENYNSISDWDFVFLKWQIYLFANIFMYSTFSFALIFCKPERNIVLEK